MTIFTTTFWADAAERAIKTAAQTLLGLFTLGDQALNTLTVNWGQALGLAAGAALISVLMSIISATLTSSDSASLAVRTVPKA